MRSLEFIAILTLSSLAHSNPMDAYFFNKEFINKIDWSNFHKSKIWQDSSMDSKTSIRKGDGFKIEERIYKDASAYESEFYAIKTNPMEFSMGFKVKGKSENACKHTIEKFRKTLGKESIYINNSIYISNNNDKMTSEVYRWDDENTSIRFKCNGIFGESYIGFARYTPKASTEPEIEPVKLKCEVKIEKNATVVTSFPLNIILIPEERIVTNEDRFYKGRLSFTSKYYRFKIGDNRKMDIEIDRHTGKITGGGQAVINGSVENYNTTGLCENKQ